MTNPIISSITPTILKNNHADKKWINYWAVRDVFSGPLNGEFPRITDQTVDNLSDLRNSDSTTIYHAITSLNVENVPNEYKMLAANFRNRVKNDICMVNGDSDGDGIGDLCDDCPKTPAGVSVDAQGCPSLGKWLSFVEGNPAIPGDGGVISGSYPSFEGFWLVAPISFDQFNDGFTISVFLPPNMQFPTSFTLHYSNLKYPNSCSWDGSYFGWGGGLERTSFDGSEGFYVNFRPEYMESLVQLGNYYNCNITPSDLVIDYIYFSEPYMEKIF